MAVENSILCRNFRFFKFFKMSYISIRILWKDFVVLLLQWWTSCTCSLNSEISGRIFDTKLLLGPIFVKNKYWLYNIERSDWFRFFTIIYRFKFWRIESWQHINSYRLSCVVRYLCVCVFGCMSVYTFSEIASVIWNSAGAMMSASSRWHLFVNIRDQCDRMLSIARSHAREIWLWNGKT